MFASRLHPHVKTSVLSCQNGDKIRFSMFFTVILKNCQLQFSHNYMVLSLIIHDDKTVNSYFMPRQLDIKR